MDDSLVLLSTMSPKPSKTNRRFVSKKVTKLALKKHFRQSSNFDKLPQTIRNSSVLLVESESNETASTSSNADSVKAKQKTEVIVISDGDLEEGNIKAGKNVDLSPSKFKAVSSWVSKVNAYQHDEDNSSCNVSVFTDLSVIHGEKKTVLSEQGNLNIAVNSTFVSNKNCFRFDEFFHKTKSDVNVIDKDEKINNDYCDKLCVEEKISLVMNRQLKENQLKETDVGMEAKNTTPCHMPNRSENEEYEKMLDELYGNSWRPNREKVLSNTEPRRKKGVADSSVNARTEKKVQKKSITYKNPYLESEVAKSKNLLRTLQSARVKMMIESPWIKNFHELCDSDTDSSELFQSDESPPGNNMQKLCGKKLTFSDYDSDSESECRNLTSKDRISSKNTTARKPTTVKKLEYGKTERRSSSDKENFSGLHSDIEPLEERLKKKLIMKSNDTFNKKVIKTQTISNNHVSTTQIKKNHDKINNVGKERGNKFREVKRTAFGCSSTSSDSSLTTDRVSNMSEKKRIDLASKNLLQREDGPLSFLASLAATVPVVRCDASAKLFRDCYKTYKSELARKLFKLYNEKVFENSLPNNTPLEWNDRLIGTAGTCRCKKITHRSGRIEYSVVINLSTKVLNCAERLRDTLLHEMCHAAAHVVNQAPAGHGPHWKAWAAKAMKTFPELPPIRVCHSYEINTKYTYKCSLCGYSIGRHSKSLNIEKKRCGYCYGKFELLVNKVTKNGVQSSVPATPKKKATGFALFVKQNYAEMKTPQRNHKDIMQLLGQKFSAMKTK